MLHKIQENWDTILQYMRDKFDISKVSYESWLLPLKVDSVDEESHMVGIVITDPQIESIGIDFIRKKIFLYPSGFHRRDHRLQMHGELLFKGAV